MALAIDQQESVGDSTASGELTLASRSCGEVAKPVRFYGSWRCPYSQRAWIGLEEKVVDYQWIEVDVYESSSDGRERRRLSLDELRGRYPEFVACSPRGSLPALEHRGERIHDSLVTAEYIHEAFDGPPLLPKTPYLRARVRLWAAHVESRVVPHFDALLVARDEDQRQQARQALIEGLTEFEAAMAPEAEGPFFLGDDFSMADIALVPWWQRMVSVLRAYRKFDPSVHPRLQAWHEAVQARPSVRRTAVDPERLIEDHVGCADLRGTSEGVGGDVRFRRASAPRRGRGLAMA